MCPHHVPPFSPLSINAFHVLPNHDLAGLGAARRRLRINGTIRSPLCLYYPRPPQRKETLVISAPKPHPLLVLFLYSAPLLLTHTARAQPRPKRSNGPAPRPLLTAANRLGRLLRNVAHVRPRIREHDVGALHRAAPIVHIGHKDARPRRPRGRLGGRRRGVPRAAPLDRDVRAVHVHLAVANLVEPRPGKEGVAGGRVGGQGEVPFRGERAAADKGADDGEGGAGVVGQRDLARAALVGGAALERDAVGLAGGPVGHGPALVGVEQLVVALARVRGARVREGVVHVVVDAGGVGVVLGPEGRRRRHLHVGGGEAREGEDDDAEMHLETWALETWCFCFSVRGCWERLPWGGGRNW